MVQPLSSNEAIAHLQLHSLANLVQAEIERMILQGELQSGAKLTEATLADQLGVSRGPVREAFRMLEESGLVRTIKNRGVFVRDIPIEEAVEIFDLRAAMEELVGRQLAGKITPAQLKEVRGLVDGMERAVKADDIDAYHLLNLQFHDRLVEMAGNTKLTAIYRKLIKELSLFRRMNLAHGPQMPLSAGEHRQIFLIRNADDWTSRDLNAWLTEHAQLTASARAGNTDLSLWMVALPGPKAATP